MSVRFIVLFRHQTRLSGIHRFALRQRALIFNRYVAWLRAL
nr:hypothetical protein [Mixta theicola]